MEVIKIRSRHKCKAGTHNLQYYYAGSGHWCLYCPKHNSIGHRDPNYHRGGKWVFLSKIEEFLQSVYRFIWSENYKRVFNYKPRYWLSMKIFPHGKYSGTFIVKRYEPRLLQTLHGKCTVCSSDLVINYADQTMRDFNVVVKNKKLPQKREIS